VRILILGGDGMLGHQLFSYFRGQHDVKVTLRQDIEVYSRLGLFNGANAYGGVDLRSLETLTAVMADFRCEAVINAVGITKQQTAATESIPSLEINALLPHRLAVVCKGVNARLVHLSTDCVFSGRKGAYVESDPSDAEDLYGKTKFLGELHDRHCLTLRTSIIGRELSRHQGLLEWFLAQEGRVRGYRKAIFTGVTTLELSRIIEDVLSNHPGASGLFHVSSEPISKYELLLLFREKLGHRIEIVPDDTLRCDRSLDSTRFRAAFHYTPPSWSAMIEELRRPAGAE
jgi:dTDP-4-dehydrorhamnose reductase